MNDHTNAFTLVPIRSGMKVVVGGSSGDGVDDGGVGHLLRSFAYLRHTSFP